MANRVPITIRLESFEGPLDLLLYLIQSHELSISKVSITQITDQYLAYVLLMQELNFDIASEFLVMAATLIHWKSRALLPQENKDENGNTLGEETPLTQEELVRQLLEHQRFMDAGDRLAEIPRLGEEVFARSNRKPPIQRIWREMNIGDLALSYQQILMRMRKRTQVLRKETVSIVDKILEFADRLTPQEKVELQSFLSAHPSKAEIVATFLAALELSRLKKMRLYQDEVYTAIFMELLEDIRNFDFDLATGFDAPQTNPPGNPETPAAETEPPAVATELAPLNS